MQKISTKKTRDIGEVFNAASIFIRQNFKTFYGSLLLFAGPFLFAGSLYSAFIRMPLYGLFSGLPFGVSNFLGIYASTISALFIGIVVFIAVLNKNVILNETLPESEKTTISDIRENIVADLLRMLGSMLLFAFLVIFIVVCTSAVLYGFFSIFGDESFSPGMTSIFAILLFLLFIVILLPVIGFMPIAALFVCQRDKISIIAALGKVFRYLKGNFWSTWVFSLLSVITYFVLAFIVQIPMIVFTLVSNFSRINVSFWAGPNSIIVAISTLLTYFVVAIYYLLNIFHFTSLEEKKEGSSLFKSINEII